MKIRASLSVYTLEHVMLIAAYQLGTWLYCLTDIQIPGQAEEWLFCTEQYFKQNLNPKWDLEFTSELMEMWIRSKTRSMWSNSLELGLTFFSLLIKKEIVFFS
jgi:hypothetical protein